jgi:8-oxo-dGTP pyrophosphatase MutT (NUDIX family)
MVGGLVSNIIASLVTAVLLAVVAVGFRSFRDRLWLSLARLLTPGLRRSGLVASHGSMAHARRSIERAVSNSTRLDVMGIRGVDLLGGDRGLLTAVLHDRRRDRPVALRLMLLSPHARWVSEELARRRGKESVAAIRNELLASHSIVSATFDQLKPTRPPSGIRFYADDPSWRLIITDSRLFVSSYAGSEQARDVEVLEVDHAGDVYGSWSRYFENVWAWRSVEAYDAIPSTTTAPTDLVGVPTDELELSAGGVVFQGSGDERRYLLLQRVDGTLVLPKGHVGRREETVLAAVREISEESGLDGATLQHVSTLGWWPTALAFPNGTRSNKITHYFLFEYVGPWPSTLHNGADHVSASWYTAAELTSLRLGYEHVSEVIGVALRHFE